MSKKLLAAFLAAIILLGFIFVTAVRFDTVRASTSVTGIINSDTTWTKANSPYVFTGPAGVAANVTLTIEPGVTVHLGSYYLQVNGTLSARGAVNDIISFTSSLNFMTNGYINFASLSSSWNDSTATGCIIENAILLSTSIITNKVSIKINNCTLSGGYGQAPLYFQGGGKPVISNSTLIGYGGYYVSAAIYCSSTNATISDNFIHGWVTNAIYASYASPTIERNLIINNTGPESSAGGGIRIDGSNSRPTIRNNTIARNSIGINLLSNPSPEIAFNNIYDNLYYSISLPSSSSSYTTININATYNWWGTTDVDAIDESIHDFKDDFNLGNVTFIPFLNSSNPAAPIIPKVHNLDTGLGYSSIQAAIDAPETLNGHTIFVDNGTYYEHVVINKSITLQGESRNQTIIDGNQTGTAVTIDEMNVEVCGFTIQNSTPDFNAGILVAYGATGANIRNNTILDNYWGIYLNSSGNILLENEFVNNELAVRSDYTEDNIILDNIFRDNQDGVLFSYCSYSAIFRSVFTDNFIGISLFNSSSNSIFLNNITGSYIACSLISNSDENALILNNFVNNDFGVTALHSAGNSILGNNITENENCGLNLIFASNNTMFYNNFVDNTNHVFATANASLTWAEEYPYGGNFWSNYTGVDNKRGPLQNLLGSDGIGDTPHVINVNYTDPYPLINPFPAPLIPPPTISDLQRLVIEADADEALFLFADPYRATAAVSTYDVASGGIVYGMADSLQRQGFDSNSQVVSQSAANLGKLLVNDSTVLMFGGPMPHLGVRYLESHDLAPVYFQAVQSSIDGVHYLFKETSSGIAIVDVLASSIDPNHEDYFVLESLIDENNNHVFVSYGFNWKGTWAAGIYLKSISENLYNYTNGYYIIYWQDTNADGIPQPNEMSEVAQGQNQPPQLQQLSSFFPSLP